MNWNYRVIEFVDPDGITFRRIHEVFYEDGRPVSYGGEAIVMWEVESKDKPEQILNHIREALWKPVLKQTDFVEPPENK